MELTEKNLHLVKGLTAARGVMYIVRFQRTHTIEMHKHKQKSNIRQTVTITTPLYHTRVVYKCFSPRFFFFFFL